MHITNMRSHKEYREEGAILVEMAFVLPILALIFIIIIDGGLAIREHQLLQNAAREAARFASLPPVHKFNKLWLIIARKKALP